MSSSTSSSDARRLLRLSLGGVAVSLLAVTLVLRFGVSRYTTANRFIDDKRSKFLHLERRAPDGVGIVFLGSSFVKNHLSTRYFEERGISAYNFGISGRLLGDFPSMTVAALRRHPKSILYTLSAEELFGPVSTDFAEPEDLSAFVRTGQPIRTVAPAAWNYVLNMNGIHYFREAIYNQLRSTLTRLDWHGRRPGPVSAAAGVPKPRFPEEVSQQLAMPADCDVFKVTDYPKMRVVTCTNGDGIQYGVVDEAGAPQAWPVRRLEEPNPHSLALLNQVIRTARAAGSQPIVLLKPVWGERLEYDASLLRRGIDAPVVDFTSSTYTRGDWCDQGHLNYYGRLKHSHDVFEATRRLGSSNEDERHGAPGP